MGLLDDPTPLAGTLPPRLAARCGLCGDEHVLHNDVAAAHEALARLFHEIATRAERQQDRNWLEGSRGKMIGVLVAQAASGERLTVAAFSGDLGGQEEQPGWAPTIVRRADTAALQAESWQAIAALDAQLPLPGRSDETRLRETRRNVSRRLMASMIDATLLTTRGGSVVPLRRAFTGHRIPSGTADCVLPKLLVFANRQHLRVVGVAEAWWGPAVGNRRHGEMQAPCDERCAPILGALLCDGP